MAFIHSKSGAVYVNETSQSADIKSWQVSHSRDLGDTTALADTGSKGIPGLMEGELKVEAHFDSTALKMRAIVQGEIGEDNGLVVTISPDLDGATGSSAVGKIAIFGAFDVSNFEIEASVDSTVGMSIEGKADGMVDIGHVLANRTVTVDVDEGSVDNLASSANGGAGVLHITSASASDTMDVKIQHSTDNSAWVDLITFTQATTATHQFSTVAAGTTVNRYTRVSHNIGGTSPSFPVFVAFARR